MKTIVKQSHRCCGPAHRPTHFLPPSLQPPYPGLHGLSRRIHAELTPTSGLRAHGSLSLCAQLLLFKGLGQAVTYAGALQQIALTDNQTTAGLTIREGPILRTSSNALHLIFFGLSFLLSLDSV